MAKAPGTIRQRGNGWQVIIRVNGQRHQFGPRSEPFLGTDRTRKEVDEWVWRKHKKLEKVAKREAEGLPESLHFSELVKKVRAEKFPLLAKGTQRAYEETLRPVEKYFLGTLGDPLLENIRARHIEGYLSWRRVNRQNGQAPLSNRTLAKDRAVLHRLFKFADKWEYRDGNPVARTDEPKSDPHNPVILKEAQYERLVAECFVHGPMLGLYTLVLGEGGLRAYSEALNLRWDDIDLEEGFLHVRSGRDGHRTKSGKSRWVPMTPRLREAMREHFAAFRFAAYDGRRSPWVFHHERSRAGYTAGGRIKDLRGSFDPAVKRAKLPKGFRRHDLRHRRVTTWLAEGKPVAIVQEAMGHSDLRTTMGYKHLEKEHLRALVADKDETVEAKQGSAR